MDLASPVTVRRLSPDEAIGGKAGKDFVLCRGKEVVIEARLGAARGQAFTDQPSEWTGTLGEVFTMSLDEVRNRAIVVAVLNALAGKLGLASHVIHCRQEDPVRCGPELTAELRRRFPKVKRILLVGLQPAILAALAEELGTGGVRVVDLDPDNIGQVKAGVRVGNGAADMSDDVRWCELMLVTGSSVVNNTLDELLALSQDASKPLVFFGNTIAAVAAVADLERICPFGGHGGMLVH
ncbi:MAG TPA: DUF364 domain-containing protein [Planctomycetota bacterium]|nr:DUF364 domain-containing protein [Planctomycetota bacterium]